MTWRPVVFGLAVLGVLVVVRYPWRRRKPVDTFRETGAV